MLVPLVSRAFLLGTMALMLGLPLGATGRTLAGEIGEAAGQDQPIYSANPHGVRTASGSPRAATMD
jgi:hypothetical protein